MAVLQFFISYKHIIENELQGQFLSQRHPKGKSELPMMKEIFFPECKVFYELDP